jgi:hypothetical protein
VETGTRIELPSGVERPFAVFVNGIAQVEGVDFEVVGSTLLFPRRLQREGRLGFWRWARMVLGIAGYYVQNDSVDIVYASGGRRRVATIRPPRPEPG